MGSWYVNFFMGPNYEMDDFKFQLFLVCQTEYREGRFRAAPTNPPFCQIIEILVISTLLSLNGKLGNVLHRCKELSFHYVFL